MSSKSVSKVGIASTGKVKKAAPAKAPAKKSAVTKAPATVRNEKLAATAPSAKPSSSGDVMTKLLQEAKASGAKVVDVIKKPTQTTQISARYELSSYGRMLKHGEQLLLEVPPSLRGRPVRNVILVHRKDSSHDHGGGGDWDNSPALTAVHLHSTDLPKHEAWRHWSGPWGASGEEGAKFAEKRSSGDPEFETEFNWPENGHQGVGGGGHSSALLYVDAMRVKALGQDPSFVHSVELQVAPEKPSQVLEAVFTPGTSLGDPETLEGSHLGGGQNHGGKYPGALALSGYSSQGSSKLPAGWKISNGALEIPLKAGMLVTGVDIACGDTHPDGVHNKDGGTGTPGWSRLTMRLVKAGGGGDESFMTRQGVPPEGILSAAPSRYVAKAGDVIRISAESDTTYVMAVRVGLAKP